MALFTVMLQQWELWSILSCVLEVTLQPMVSLRLTTTSWQCCTQQHNNPLDPLCLLCIVVTRYSEGHAYDIRRRSKQTSLLHFDNSLSLACHSANCTVSHPNVSVLVSSGFKSKQYIEYTKHFEEFCLCCQALEWVILITQALTCVAKDKCVC